MSGMAMRDILTTLIDAVRDRGATEFVETIAKPYPSLTIATVMGAPAADAMKLHEWSAWIQRQFDAPSLLNQRDRIEQAVVEFYAWCDELLARRRESPEDDLISILVAVEADGDRLSDHELKASALRRKTNAIFFMPSHFGQFCRTTQAASVIVGDARQRRNRSC